MWWSRKKPEATETGKGNALLSKKRQVTFELKPSVIEALNGLHKRSGLSRDAILTNLIMTRFMQENRDRTRSDDRDN